MALVIPRPGKELLASKDTALGGKSWRCAVISSTSSMLFAPNLLHSVVTHDMCMTLANLDRAPQLQLQVPLLFHPTWVLLVLSFSLYSHWSPLPPTISPPTPQIRKRSQAGRAGLRERDHLLAINGVSCTSLSHASAMSLIDASGTQLVLTVRRYGPSLPFTLAQGP